MAEINWKNRTLFHLDNLHVLRGMNSNTVDLIATDPPFNKGRDFHATPGSLSDGGKFQDRWNWRKDAHEEWIKEISEYHTRTMEVIQASRRSYGNDMGAFLCFMATRLLEMHRVLKPTGTIYLHCDPTASHYLKQLMDSIFGHDNFRNEIVWCYSGGGIPNNDYPRKHDIILRYTKSDEYTFNVERKEYKENTKQVGKHSTLSGGHAIDLDKGTPVTDWWTDIKTVTGWHPENVGWATQKPIDLYARMIRASSNKNDVVLDPFCGCATTCVAAERYGRQWVGVDLWDGAKDVIKQRMKMEADFGDTLVKKEFRVMKKPPVRTDNQQVAAEPLEPVFALQKPQSRHPRMSRTEMMEKLVEQHGAFCQGCGFVPPDDNAGNPDLRYFEIDHIRPKSEGGDDSIGNRTLLCRPCNQLKDNVLTLTGLRQQNKKLGYMKKTR